MDRGGRAAANTATDVEARGLLLAALLSASFSACNDVEHRPLPELSWEGEVLRFGQDDPGEPVCGGTLPYMDAYVEELAMRLGLPDARVDFYLLTAEEYAAYGVCASGDAWACASGARVFSSVVPQEHELVHAVRAPKGLRYRVLEEGLAEFWGDDAQWRPTIGSDIDGLLDNDDAELSLADYGLAGHFTSYLVAEYDVESLQDLLARTPYRANRLDLAKQFEASYGVPLADVVADYTNDYPACPQHEYRRPGPECGAASDVALSCESEEILRAEVLCDDATTLGPRDDEIWQHVSIEVVEAGRYFFFVSADPATVGDRIEVKKCTGGCGSFALDLDIGDGVGGNAYAELAEGSHVVRFTRPDDAPGTIELHVTGACQ